MINTEPSPRSTSFKNEAITKKSRLRQIAYKGLESTEPEVGIFSDTTTKYFFFELVQLDNSEHGLKKVTANLGDQQKEKKDFSFDKLHLEFCSQNI